MARDRSTSPGELIARHIGASPPPLPQSKRDKRRTMLTDKLNDMIASFGTNLRPHYEAQANAINIDINLIHHADPYQNKPLEDDPDEIAKLISSTTGGKVPSEAVAEQDFYAGAGKMYTEFVHEVNNAMEERDVNLTLLHNKHQTSMNEIEQRYQFHVRLAHEENRLLASSIRERLQSQLTRRKERLLREKDMLDIGDSNALLLHPNQFGITNPASPGGTGKRYTRGTGRRGADHDDPASIVQEKSRKRQRLFEEVEDLSPAPGPSRNVDIGSGSPFRNAKAKTAWHQQEAPAYSIDRLFTEKELAMTMNNAGMAAQHFLLKQHAQSQGHNGNGTNGNHAEVEESGASGVPPTGDVDMEDEGMIDAPSMERMASQTHHATRGTTRALAGLAAVASGEIPSSLGNIIPTFIPAIIGSKANSAPVQVVGLTASEIEHDLNIMLRDTNGEDDFNDKLLERAIAPQSTAEYQYQPPSVNADSFDHGGSSLMPNLASNFPGVSMSRQSSQAGFSEIPVMSRTNSARGGLPMARTASQQGSAVGQILGSTENVGKARRRLV
ncbi:hypothetical protein EG328_010813 [Venturia inaequalis]|uniref:Deacetylase complex subunit Sds3 n=2 Tax=Venturia inaequalis TaxID=5025 RepID=A0A8H3V5L1_VENIN|nr:hypothetical protein EG328_010813 [Venturia inaequalis]KAE9990432.1 hypothetical protein EG327_001385 [Venturia inaequalis]